MPAISPIAVDATGREVRVGLSSLQIAALDALEIAFRKRLISNGECLALLTDWQNRIDAG
ncbi:hypothetical protein [Ralstonia sp. ASV6]|uniref:hypothetical protein n=1 Tax=Ralstonia sp. ASV6 TaxID=2795124 RepID=UPI001E47B716|nr:hypothetical protein [Ralstonia sp. ASV6]